MEKWSVFFDRVLDSIQEIPIQEIIGREIRLEQRGRYWMGLCPFHPDTKMGSFVVTPHLNLFKCFSCGHHGNSINFIMQYKDLNFVDACLYIAKEFDIITEDECSHHSFADFANTPKPKTKIQTTEKESSPVATPDVINYVYNALPKIFGLNNAHYKVLTKERNIPQDRLNDFFTVRQNIVDIERLILTRVATQIIEETGLTRQTVIELKNSDDIRVKILCKKYQRIKDNLKYVPGFFRNRDGQLCYAAFNGIGFIIRDDAGHAIGIQVRRDKIKKGEARYVWFSSSFAIQSNFCDGGASSGSPGGILLAKNRTSRCALCITEGRFKAEQIVSKGNDAIYVSGVSTWKSILPLVKSTIGSRKVVFLMFDADMMGNVAVHTQLAGLGNALIKTGIKVRLILWSKDAGKGFDDLVISKGTIGYKDYLKTVDFNKFEAGYKEVLENTLSQFNAKTFNKLDKELVDDFEKTLQSRVEEKFLS